MRTEVSWGKRGAMKLHVVESTEWRTICVLTHLIVVIFLPGPGFLEFLADP
jgi:hypothetical protein